MGSSYVVLRYDHHGNIDMAFIFDDLKEAQKYLQLIDDERYTAPIIVPAEDMTIK